MKNLLLFILIVTNATIAAAQKKVFDDPLNHVGDTVTISGKVYGGAFLKNVKTQPTFLNVGDTNPTHRLMIRIEPEDRSKFAAPPESYFINKQVSVSGVVQNYKGTALISVADPASIQTEAPAPAMNAGINANPVFNNNVAKTAPVASRKVPDTLLQTKWVQNVASAVVEQATKNLRVVQKEIPLHISPNDESPVIAALNPGIVVSVLSRSRKWSQIVVRAADGSNSVFGFIRNKKLKQTKRLL